MKRTMMKVLCTGAMMLAIAVFSTGIAQAAKSSAAKGSPMRAIQDLDDKLDQFRVREEGKPLSPEDEAFNRNLKREIIGGTFDVDELSRLSLAKHWKDRTDAQRQQFAQLLSDLLEEKALFSKEQSMAKSKKGGGKYFVTYKSQKFLSKDGTRAFVGTSVTVPSENITIALNYRLMKVDGQWKIFDVIVDEASLVDNYRYQFNSIITKSGYPDLVARMQKKLGEIRGQRKTKDEPASAAVK